MEVIDHKKLIGATKHRETERILKIKQSGGGMVDDKKL